MVLGLDLEALLTAIASASIGSTLFSTWRNRQTVEDMRALLVEMRAKEIEKIKVAVAPPGGFIPPAPARRGFAREPPPRRLPPVVGPPPRVARPPAREPAYEEPPPPPHPIPEPEVQRPAAPARRVIQEEETIRRRRIEESGTGEEAPREPEPPVREVVDLERERPREATTREQATVLEPPRAGREPRGDKPPRARAPLPPPPPAPLPARTGRPAPPSPPPPPVHVPRDENARQRLLTSRRGLAEILEEQVKKGTISRQTRDYLASKAPLPPSPARPPEAAHRVKALVAALEAQRAAGAISEETFRKARAKLEGQLPP